MTSSSSVKSEVRRPDIPKLDTRTVNPAAYRCGHDGLNVFLGIEVTTGPLGQGISSAVGLAIAQAHLAASYNKEGFNLINNYTYGRFQVLKVGLSVGTHVL